MVADGAGLTGLAEQTGLLVASAVAPAPAR
jgi:hypothetical protein